MSRYIVLALALVQGCWLTLDGGRALTVGDYFTPRSGVHAGQLGPWAGVASSFGVAPRGLLMKSLYFGDGLLWLSAFLAMALRQSRGRWLTIVAAVATLWFVPFGTLSSAIVIVLLLFGRTRNGTS